MSIGVMSPILLSEDPTFFILQEDLISKWIFSEKFIAVTWTEGK